MSSKCLVCGAHARRTDMLRKILKTGFAACLAAATGFAGPAQALPFLQAKPNIARASGGNVTTVQYLGNRRTEGPQVYGNRPSQRQFSEQYRPPRTNRDQRVDRSKRHYRSNRGFYRHNGRTYYNGHRGYRHQRPTLLLDPAIAPAVMAAAGPPAAPGSPHSTGSGRWDQAAPCQGAMSSIRSRSL